MSDTPKLGLPLLAAAQAQKHVTVNEALTRLDAVAAASALSASLSAPPVAVDGDAYIVGPAATGDWAGREDSLAFFVNGGWDFAAPRTGWWVWVTDQGRRFTYAGDRWVAEQIGGFQAGAYCAALTISSDEALSGASVTAALMIPDRAVVIGITARVLSDITGAGVTGWRLGVAGATDRYGSSIGLLKDSVVNGVTGAPVGYFAETPLEIGAEGGSFDGGSVRLAVHYLALTPPTAV